MRVVALCLMVATSALAQQPPKVHVWDVPQALDAVDVPGRVEAGGLPVAIHAVRSKQTVDQLLQHFRTEFTKKGLFLPPPEHLTLRTTLSQVTGLDPDTFIAYTVFLQPNADGTTTALITETFLAERRAPGEVDFAPVMPGARGVIQSRTEGLRMVSYRAPATVEEAWAFHRAVFAEAAYKETAPGVFEHDGTALRVVIQPLSKQEVAVSVMEGAAARQPVEDPLGEDEPSP